MRGRPGPRVLSKRRDLSARSKQQHIKGAARQRGVKYKGGTPCLVPVGSRGPPKPGLYERGIDRTRRRSRGFWGVLDTIAASDRRQAFDAPSPRAAPDIFLLVLTQKHDGFGAVGSPL